MTWKIFSPNGSSPGLLRNHSAVDVRDEARAVDRDTASQAGVPVVGRAFAVGVVVHRAAGTRCGRGDNATAVAARVVDLDRVAVAVEAARCGYALADVREVDDDDPVTSFEWADAWNMAVHVNAAAVIVSGTPNLPAVEAVATRLGLRLHLSPRTGPGLARLRPHAESVVGNVCVREALAPDRDAADGHGAGRRLPAPLEPPAWAERSVVEDDGITHEMVSPRRPLITTGDHDGWLQVPSEVSLSVQDIPVADTWIRTRPSLVIDGGIYDLDAARQLHDILTDLLAITAGFDT
jgi:hypothetical protein